MSTIGGANTGATGSAGVTGSAGTGVTGGAGGQGGTGCQGASSLSVVAIITVGRGPQGVAVSPTGVYGGDIYVANSLANTVSVISPG